MGSTSQLDQLIQSFDDDDPFYAENQLLSPNYHIRRNNSHKKAKSKDTPWYVKIGTACTVVTNVGLQLGGVLPDVLRNVDTAANHVSAAAVNLNQCLDGSIENQRIKQDLGAILDVTKLNLDLCNRQITKLDQENFGQLLVDLFKDFRLLIRTLVITLCILCVISVLSFFIYFKAEFVTLTRFGIYPAITVLISGAIYLVLNYQKDFFVSSDT